MPVHHIPPLHEDLLGHYHIVSIRIPCLRHYEAAARLRQAYPPETDGATLFPFRRLFIVARAA